MLEAIYASFEIIEIIGNFRTSVSNVIISAAMVL